MRVLLLFCCFVCIVSDVFSPQVIPNQERVRRSSTTYFGHFELQPRNVDTKNSNIGDINDSDGIGYAFYFLVDNRIDVTVNAIGLRGAVTQLRLMCNAGGQFDCRPKFWSNPPPRRDVTPCPTVCVDVLALAGSVSFPVTISTTITPEMAVAIRANDAYVEIWSTGYNVYGELRGSMYRDPPSTQITDDGTFPHGFVFLDGNLGHGFWWMVPSTTHAIDGRYKFFARVYHILASSDVTESRVTDLLRGDGDGLYYIGRLGESGPRALWSPGYLRDNPMKATQMTLETFQRDELFRAEVYFQLNYNPRGVNSTRGQLYPMFYPIIDHFTDFAVKLDIPTRGYEGAVITVAVRFPSSSIGNEIWVTFPKDFALNTPNQSTVEFPLGINAPSELVTQGRTAQLRWNATNPLVFTNATNPTATFTLTKLALPNNCNPGTYVLDTHTCFMRDVQGAGTHFVHDCQVTADDFTLSRLVSTAGVPEACRTCQACKHLYNSPTGDAWYSCQQDGLTFFRTNIPNNTLCTLY
eukprot:TRINITY_DN8743_c0_g1_i1.p1 TRINITY_DN8743_c0_g1~~TRINITY_DN8743_c0_g1_i1.p1  ORF type:complete len:523 (-),score=67.98 TRINITY_DN8743_c0_g1_i1:37-1605(-)